MKTKEYEIISRSPEETRRFGVFLGRHAPSGLVIALSGELGAGKTCLTQGIARGLGVPEEFYVTSPSFTLVNQYPGRIDLCHVDLYRIETRVEIEETGLEEMMLAQHVVVVEWADKAAEILPYERLSILMSIVDDQVRHLQLTGCGQEASHLVEKSETFA